MLILLDGSKGAGKSTVSAILLQKLQNSVSFALDIEKNALQDQTKPRPELNKEAFKIIEAKTKEALASGQNVIIDCGLTEERLSIFENMSRVLGVELYRIFLKASKDKLLERVRNRDKAKNKETDVERFDEVFDIVHSKEFKEFIIIETDELNTQEVADKIISLLN